MNADIIYVDPDEDTVNVGSYRTSEDCLDKGGIKYIRYDQIEIFVILDAIKVLSRDESYVLNGFLRRAMRFKKKHTNVQETSK